MPNKIPMRMMSGWLAEYRLTDPAWAPFYNQWLTQHGYDPSAYPSTADKAWFVWQNYYNEEILRQAQRYGLDPLLLKGQMMVESNGTLDPGDYCQVNGQTHYCRNWGAVGLMQITDAAMGDVLGEAPEELLEQIVNLYAFTGGPNPGVSPPLPPFVNEQGKPKYESYSAYYASLSEPQRSAFNTLALRFVDGVCYSSDAQAGLCIAGTIQPQEGNLAIQLAAAINDYNRDKLITRYIGEATWNSLPKIEQDKIMLAAYNGGLDAIGKAAANVIAKKGQLTSWNDVQAELFNGRSSYTVNWCQVVVYPANAMCYVTGGGNQCLQPVQTDYNDADGDGNTWECAP